MKREIDVMMIQFRPVRLRSFLVVFLCLTVWAPAVQAQSKQSIIRYETIHNPVVGQYGMVASQNNYATLVGRNILQQGGNAVDAAVAMGFTLAVTLPRAGNLGGSGFMLVHLAGEGKTIALDYRSMAPLSARASVNGRVALFRANAEVRGTAPGILATQ